MRLEKANGLFVRAYVQVRSYVRTCTSCVIALCVFRHDHDDEATASSSPPLDDTRMFESCGGTLCELHDGHIPETHHETSKYLYYEEEMKEPPVVRVYDNAVSPFLVNQLYNTTVAEGLPWGTYVTIKQVKEYCQTPAAALSSTDEKLLSHDELALRAVTQFLKKTDNTTATAIIPPNNTQEKSLCSSKNIHGVAVWALASDSREVEYHIDYAELVRYEKNVVATPVWAGTLQCTSTSSIKGGQFAVNVNGMDHYKHHGYKGHKSGKNMGGWTQPPSNENDVDYNTDTGWVTIPYRYNRMIQHSGHLPHLSAPFILSKENGYRVIVGFNVFRNDVGPTVSQAPEHSFAFRRRIKCHRAAVLLNSSFYNKMSLENIRQHKALTKLLVLAKREKIKADLRRAQEQLDANLDTMLQNGSTTLVETLMNRLGRTDGEWPSPIDVQVHVDRRVSEGTLVCVDSDDSNKRVTLQSPIQLKC